MSPSKMDCVVRAGGASRQWKPSGSFMSLRQGTSSGRNRTEKLKNCSLKDSKCYSAPAKDTLHGNTYPYSKSYDLSKEFRHLGFSALAQRFKIRCCYCCSATQSCPALWPHRTAPQASLFSAISRSLLKSTYERFKILWAKTAFL